MNYSPSAVCRIPVVVLVLSFVVALLSTSRAEDDKKKGPKESPNVIEIFTFAAAKDAESNPPKPASQSQGFVIEKSGMILTSYRTLIDPKTEELRSIVQARRLDKKKAKPVDAAIIAVEPTLNFAILKIEDVDKLKASKIAKREDIVPELAVHVRVGTKKGKPVFNSGEITDLNSMDCYQESMTATMLQAAIEIPDGVLGGPVFNSKGEVVALHSGYIKREEEDEEHEKEKEAEGKVHILPIFIVTNIYESVKLKGNTKSPWTGFSVRALTEKETKVFPIGRFLGGVAIDHVWEKGPADKEGVHVGDYLVGFSYYPTKNVAAFQKWLYMYGVDYKVKLHFIRGGEEYFSYDYTIEERPKWAKPR